MEWIFRLLIGNISVQIAGTDLYVGLLDTWGSKDTKYHFTIASFNNTLINLKENEEWQMNNDVASTNFSVPNSSILYPYTVSFTKSNKTIAVYFNHNLVFSYTDSNYISQVGSAQYISFSQHNSNVIIFLNCPQLTISKTACANTILNCTSYSDDTKCLTCNTSTYMSVGKLACANEIQNCISYSDDSLCLSCNTPTYLSVGKLACAIPIENCSSYSDDSLCQTCNIPTYLTSGKLACANQILNCTSYSDDTLCES